MYHIDVFSIYATKRPPYPQRIEGRGTPPRFPGFLPCNGLFTVRPRPQEQDQPRRRKGIAPRFVVCPECARLPAICYPALRVGTKRKTPVTLCWGLALWLGQSRHEVSMLQPHKPQQNIPGFLRLPRYRTATSDSARLVTHARYVKHFFCYSDKNLSRCAMNYLDILRGGL